MYKTLVAEDDELLTRLIERRNLNISMVDPKGAGPKIRGKSKAYELIERDRRRRQEFDIKLWPALPAELVQIDEPDFDSLAPKFTELGKAA